MKRIEETAAPTGAMMSQPQTLNLLPINKLPAVTMASMIDTNGVFSPSAQAFGKISYLDSDCRLIKVVALAIIANTLANATKYFFALMAPKLKPTVSAATTPTFPNAGMSFQVTLKKMVSAIAIKPAMTVSNHCEVLSVGRFLVLLTTGSLTAIGAGWNRG